VRLYSSAFCRSRKAETTVLIGENNPGKTSFLDERDPRGQAQLLTIFSNQQRSEVFPIGNMIDIRATHTEPITSDKNLAYNNIFEQVTIYLIAPNGG
jgi:hypothetical protein